MANPLEYINSHPKETKRMLGISYQDLQQLIYQAEQRDQNIQTQKEQSEIRLIAKGGGRKPSLSNAEQIVLTLTYLRQHVTFQVLGLLFNVCESTAHNMFHYWLPIFHDILPESLFVQLQAQDSDWAFSQELLEQCELIVDSSEQERERPTGYREQEIYYSGYKKKHTFKNMYIVLPKGKDIVDVTVGEPGPTSDITQFREAQSKFSPRQQFRGDTGYQGEANIATPHKRTKQRKLTSEEKEKNKAFAQKRVYVEHTIRGVKIFRIAQQRFRLRGKRYPLVMKVICGLVRLRIGALVLPSNEHETAMRVPFSNGIFPLSFS